MAIFERSLTYINNRFLQSNTFYEWAPPEIVERWEWLDHYAKWCGVDEAAQKFIRDRAATMGGGHPGYVINPLPQRIVRTSSNWLAGEAPQISREDESDSARQTEIIQANQLYSKIKRACAASSRDGGVYGLPYTDTRTPRGRKSPLIRFVKERLAVPVFKNDDELVEVTFIGQWAPHPNKPTVIRLLEKHEPGLTSHKLYEGTLTELGSEISLDSFDPTRGLRPAWETGIDELIPVYIPNHLGADSPLGVSDLEGLEDLFLAINETATMAQDDIHSSGNTTFASEELKTKNMNLPQGSRVVWTGEEAGGNKQPTLELIQPQVRAESFRGYQDYMIGQALMYAGLAPQSLGLNVQGNAESGTARRMMMGHTVIEMAGKAKLWEEGLAHVMRMAAKLDAKGFEGKAAVSWNDPDAPVTVKMADGMPQDLREIADTISKLRSAGVISREAAVRQILGEEATKEEVDAELERLDEEDGAVLEAAAKSVAPAIPPAPADQGTAIDDLLGDLA